MTAHCVLTTYEIVCRSFAKRGLKEPPRDWWEENLASHTERMPNVALAFLDAHEAICDCYAADIDHLAAPSRGFTRNIPIDPELAREVAADQREFDRERQEGWAAP